MLPISSSLATVTRLESSPSAMAFDTSSSSRIGLKSQEVMS
jgi:hypothetical protein